MSSRKCLHDLLLNDGYSIILLLLYSIILFLYAIHLNWFQKTFIIMRKHKVIYFNSPPHIRPTAPKTRH